MYSLTMVVFLVSNRNSYNSLQIHPPMAIFLVSKRNSQGRHLLSIIELHPSWLRYPISNDGCETIHAFGHPTSTHLPLVMGSIVSNPIERGHCDYRRTTDSVATKERDLALLQAKSQRDCNHLHSENSLPIVWVESYIATRKCISKPENG